MRAPGRQTCQSLRACPTCHRNRRFWSVWATVGQPLYVVDHCQEVRTVIKSLLLVLLTNAQTINMKHDHQLLVPIVDKAEGNSKPGRIAIPPQKPPPGND